MTESKSELGMFFRVLIMIGMLCVSTHLVAKTPTKQIETILKSTFLDLDSVEKKMIVLSKKEVHALSQRAQAKVDGTIFRVYLAKVKDSVVGYGVVVRKKVRTKKAVVLYIFDADVLLQSMEILSFLEPHEYKPSSVWQALFVDKRGKDCATITGATMSARMITQGAKIAKNIVEMKVK